MTRDYLRLILLALGAILLTIVVLEVVVRAGGETDADGQFSFLSFELPPYALPVDHIRGLLDAYFANPSQAAYIPDPDTGWLPRPNALLDDGIYTVNGASLRSRREYNLRPEGDTLRVALFGDSFVASSEVSDREAWGYNLEQLLNEAGVNAEVLNFGVGGYGMDQAFLRWQSQGKEYSPDIVIFVFQAENLDRNVNVFRSLYPQSGLVYSKPRFFLEEGTLHTINSPALPPEKILDAFESFDIHPLSQYEAFYSGRDISSPLGHVSKLAGLVYVTFENLYSESSSEHSYGPDSERGRLGKAIIDAFATDVADTGASFVLMHLPRFDHFRQFHEGLQLPWRYLLDYFEDKYHFINAEDFLPAKYVDDAFYQPKGHCGPEINLRIAEAVAADLLACIESKTCVSARLQDLSVSQQQH